MQMLAAFMMPDADSGKSGVLVGRGAGHIGKGAVMEGGEGPARAGLRLPAV